MREISNDTMTKIMDEKLSVLESKLPAKSDLEDIIKVCVTTKTE